jgi:streptomycin 6-kinase
MERLDLGVDAGFADRISRLEGGPAWIESLPARLAKWSRRWSLALSPPLPNLTYHYVAFADGAGGERLLLKSGPLDMTSEIRALDAFAGRGCVKLIAADAMEHVLLAERIEPGFSLRALSGGRDDDSATLAAAAVTRNLHAASAPTAYCKTTADWGRDFEPYLERYKGANAPIPVGTVERARRVYFELEDSSANRVLLHGDLHHDNILVSDRGGWLAIDPKGIAGEPAYETGALVRNLWRDLRDIDDPVRLTRRRIDLLASELSLDRDRIRGWAYSQAVLAAVWGVEDGEDERHWKWAVDMADIIGC